MDQLTEHRKMEPGCSTDNIPVEVKELLKYKYELWDRIQKKVIRTFCKDRTEDWVSAKNEGTQPALMTDFL